jgi:hypothetical protein
MIVASKPLVLTPRNASIQRQILGRVGYEPTSIVSTIEIAVFSRSFQSLGRASDLDVFLERLPTYRSQQMFFISGDKQVAAFLN